MRKCSVMVVRVSVRDGKVMLMAGTHKKPRGGGRSRAIVAAALAAVLFVAVSVASFIGVARAAGVTGKTVVDPDTTNSWTDITRPGGNPSTQNVGRIWTDKSVFDADYGFGKGSSDALARESIEKGDSDFLVSLSALSSTSNLKEMVQTGKPLDIVLVFDLSGSMDESFSGGRTRIDALKSAANSFIDATAAANDEIDDPNMRHEISLVKFAGNKNDEAGNEKYWDGILIFGQWVNYTQVVSSLDSYTSADAQTLKDAVDKLDPDGGTQSNYGMEVAESELAAHGREDAQQVVIFFTDGEPGDGYSFSTDIANGTVESAFNLKNDGALIYTVGIFNGADANDLRSNANQFMQAVSSNYPNATAYNNRGQRGEGDYYKTAADADELNTIFEEIFDETQKDVVSGSPIEEDTQEGALNPGNLTFSDQLGNYMEVTGTGAGADRMQLVYGDTIYTSNPKTTEGNVDTYTFTGEVAGNEVYKSANLADLTVKVTHNEGATGDLVEVTIPASLIPMRHYDVDTEKGTMTVTSAYPVRLFYGVSLKDEARAALNNPTDELYESIASTQTAADGSSIDFYTNSFVQGLAAGSTTATFEPNNGNKFYYYTQDTPLYTSPNCASGTEATQWDVQRGATLYYRESFWQQTGSGNAAREVTDGEAIKSIVPGSDVYGAIAYEGGRYGDAYIPAKTQRSEVGATGKNGNDTETAANVLDPTWNGTGEKATVSQRLGNNGKMSFDMPGSLEIKKTVEWGNASDETMQTKNEFTFEITASVPSDEEGKTEPLSGTYNYYVDDPEEAAGKVEFTNGKATLKVQGDTTVRIDSLPAGATFTVTEQGVGENGWTVTDNTAQEGVDNSDTTDGVVTGIIESGTQVSIDFTNTYHAGDAALTAGNLAVKKVLNGRDWRDSDSFDFTINCFRAPSGVDSLPVPEQTTLTISDATDQHTASFGDIVFSVSGEYRFGIEENSDPETPIVGINYSEAVYRAIVMVGDDGEGNLTIESVKIERMVDDQGRDLMTGDNGELVSADDPMTFTNTYEADVDPEALRGTKAYNDTTGGNGFQANKFTFQLKAKGGFETGTGNVNDLTIGAADVPMPNDAQDGTITTGNVGEGFTFPAINFNGNHVGNTYVYEVTELAGDEADAGMSYDTTTVHTVMIKVEEVSDSEGTHIVATVLPPYDTPANLKFSNTYDPEDAKLSEDTGTAIHGTKVLTGRDMLDGEAFHFELKQTSGESVLATPQIVDVTSLEDGSANFHFGDLTFEKVGHYTFTVDEVAVNGEGAAVDTTDGAGMAFDQNICTVTVDVTDDGSGTLKAEVTYSNSKHSDETEGAYFENVYEAHMNYGAEGKGGIAPTKQLVDRNAPANTFRFTVTGATDADTAKLAESDRAFTHASPLNGNATVTMAALQQLTFDQTDAGKTYSFIVAEDTEQLMDGSAASSLTNVVFDQSQYRVDIEVVDNGNGKMHTLTTVTKILDAQGEPADKVIVDKANSDDRGYTAPTFGFVNEYNPTPATVGEDADDQIQVTKKVEGADSATNYTFTLTATGDNIGNIEGLGDQNQLTVKTDGTIKAGESQTLAFGELSFTKPGIYTFTVQENEPDADAGWKFDTTAREVTVEVTDRNDDNEYDGNLYIKNVTGSPVEITNRYEAAPVVVGGEDAEQQITVQKTVTGAASTADFTFQLEPVVEGDDDTKWGNVEAVDKPYDGLTSITEDFTAGDSKTATFAGIRFKAEGEYQFKITEVGAADFNAGDDRNGWTYDVHEAFVTVTVTDNGEGQLVAELTYDNTKATAADQQVEDAAAFTNAYTTTPAELTQDAESGIGVQKTVEGAPNSANFTFIAAFNADASAEKAAAADMAAGEASGIEGLTDGKLSVTIDDDFKAGDTKAADFGTIKLTKPGVYVFDVTEDNAKVEAPNGWTYDKATCQITVTVTDNGKGQLEATVEGNDPLFTNSYHAHSVTLRDEDQLKVTKEVTGAPALSDFEFTLKLVDSDTTGVTGIDEHGITKSTSGLKDKTGDEARQTVEFGELTFTKAGTYTFQVVENTTTDAAGWTYASGEDNAKTITVTVTDDQVSGQLEATTELDGEETNNPTFTNSYKAGSITTGEGDLAKLQVTKTVTGAPATEEFSFELTPADDYGDKVAGLADGKLESSTTDLKGAEGSSTVVFGDLTFNAEGTYVFNVKETNADPKDGSGWTYDNDHAKQISVVVTDTDFDGKLEATTLVDGEDTNNPTFTNSYQPAEVTIGGDADTAITVNKQVTGRNAIEDFEFSLTLKDDQNASAVFEGKGEDKTAFNGMKVTSADDIKVGDTDTQAFGEITFTEEGDYVFVVDETTTTTAGGWAYDDATYEVTVHVKDDGQGKLYVDDIDGNGPTFVNKYELQPAMFRAAFFRLQGNKVLEGRNWEAGDEFTFTLTPGRGDNVDGSAMADGEVAATMPTKTSDTIKPLVDGSEVSDNSAQFSFTDDRYPGGDIMGNEEDVFTYSKPGTYRYLIRETNPNVSNPGSGIIGVSYDQTVYRLTVEVTDNGDGTMSAKGAYTKRNEDGTWTELNGSQDVTFTNKYSSNEVDITFNAFKVLEGRNTNMKDGEFQFHMEFAGWAANDAGADPANDADWTVDDTTNAPKPAADAPNIVRGDVTFNGMKFTSDNVGYTYRYAITEVGGGQTKDGVTYDNTTHYVTAKVMSVQQEDPNNAGSYIEFVRVETSGEAEYDEANDAAPTTGAIFHQHLRRGLHGCRHRHRRRAADQGAHGQGVERR